MSLVLYKMCKSNDVHGLLIGRFGMAKIVFSFWRKKTHSSLGVWGHPLASICWLITLYIKLLLFLGRLIKLNWILWVSLIYNHEITQVEWLVQGNFQVYLRIIISGFLGSLSTAYAFCVHKVQLKFIGNTVGPLYLQVPHLWI